VGLKISIVALALVWAQQEQRKASSVPNTYMTDPIFFITYDTRYVHFEGAPASISRLCGPLPEWKTIWTYASWKTDDAEYFVINGRRGDGTTDPYVDGLAIKLHGTECTVDRENIFNTVTDTFRRIEAPPSAVTGLAENVLRRHTAAFGGKKKFLEAVLKDPSFQMTDLWDPVRIPFEQFAKSP